MNTRFHYQQFFKISFSSFQAETNAGWNNDPPGEWGDANNDNDIQQDNIWEGNGKVFPMVPNGTQWFPFVN